MKTEKNILIAFVLNLLFSIIEVIGGILTNSVSILSDAVHDFGDTISVGLSLILEKLSKKKPNDKYTYGYQRYSVLGALITTLILSISSILIIIHSIGRIVNVESVEYNGMIILSLLGIVINFLASYFTKEGDSLNQKSVNLHMLEDTLSWVIVLIGSILIKYTNINIIDPIMSIGVAIFILVNAFINLKEIFDLFLEKTPKSINIKEIKEHINKIQNVNNVHHIHVWSIDGVNNYITMHIVTNTKKTKELKNAIKEEMKKHNIMHTTIEIEGTLEECASKECNIKCSEHHHNHHHKH